MGRFLLQFYLFLKTSALFHILNLYSKYYTEPILRIFFRLTIPPIFDKVKHECQCWKGPRSYSILMRGTLGMVLRGINIGL